MGRSRGAARKQKFEARAQASGKPSAPPPGDDAVEQEIARARRLRERGDLRRAAVTLRHACNLDEWRARSWTLLGALLADLGRDDEAADAWNRARWLRTRAGEHARAEVTARLADRFGRRAA